jgi:hypothetical protein
LSSGKNNLQSLHQNDKNTSEDSKQFYELLTGSRKGIIANDHIAA